MRQALISQTRRKVCEIEVYRNLAINYCKNIYNNPRIYLKFLDNN